MKIKESGKRGQHHDSDEEASQRIQQRAYELYENRGKESGHELEDWLQAEGELRQGQEVQRAA